MDKINLCIITGIVLILIILSYIFVKNNKEGFTSSTALKTTKSGSAIDAQVKRHAALISSMGNHTHSSTGEGADSATTKDPALDEYIRKTDIERIARVSIQNQCPVEVDYNKDDYVKKSEINVENHCPAQPNLKDYVLKSTIPPIQKCPSCICPKVKVAAGMCKKCPEPKNNCPPPKPCDVASCKDIIRCEPHQKQCAKPVCPTPQPCPVPPQKLCPAFSIEKPNIKCPPPQACPMPQPCPGGDGRCPDKKCPKCTFKGVDTVVKEKSVEEVVDRLLKTNDPKLLELLDKLKNKLNINESSSPTEYTNLMGEIQGLKDMIEEQSLENDANKLENTPTEPQPTSSSSFSKITNDTHFNLGDVYLKLKADENKPENNSNGKCEPGNCPYNTNLNI